MKIPTALVIMGSLMCIFATSIFSLSTLNQDLFTIGGWCIFIGVMSWGLIQIYNTIRIFQARKRRRELRVKTRAPAPAPGPMQGMPKGPGPAPGPGPMPGGQYRRFR